jgi:NTP pyrophosphatase (non-canonical NTP hydrolase)
MEIKEAQKCSWEISEAHGWHEREPLKANGEVQVANVALKLALVHSEVSEALEELRKGNLEKGVYYNMADAPSAKPEGFGIELADAIIRILDIAESLRIDMEECVRIKTAYNSSREYRHGNKLA